MPLTLMQPDAPGPRTLAEAVAEETRHLIIRRLNETHGCITEAAALLGIHRGTLWAMLNRYHIIPAEVVSDFRPYAAKVAKQWAKQVRCERCGRLVYHKGLLHRHRCEIERREDQT